MCDPWDTTCLATQVAVNVSNTIFGQFAAIITTAEQWIIDASASWWVMVPSISLYPDPTNVTPDSQPITSVAQLHAMIMPITVVVAVGAMIWNGILMVLSRKPAPLVNVLRGLWNTALWAGVSIFATQLLLAGTDALSQAIIGAALHSDGNPSLGKRLVTLLVPVTGQPGGLPVGIVILISTLAMICALIQAVLMFFRDGSILILASIAPLAAAGSFTSATAGWKNKVLAWWLALVFYKPMAAMVYATAIWMTNDNTSNDPRVMFFGIAMMILALVALPVLMRFFTWAIGSLQTGNGGLGMLGTTGAAGMHAAAALLGGGGIGPGQHARQLAETFDRATTPPDADPGTGRGPGPGPRPDPGPRPTPGPGGGSASPSGGFTPSFVGNPGPGATASRGAPATAPAAAPAGGSAAAAAGGAAGSSTAAGAGAGSNAAMGAAAATGPAAPVMAGVVVAGQAAVKTGKAAANAAAHAMDTSTTGA